MFTRKEAIKALEKARDLTQRAMAAQMRAMRRTGGTATAEKEHAKSAEYKERADAQFAILRRFIEESA